MAKDRAHFDEYREQTHLKHEILAAYLPAYFHILKGSSKNLVFIDGFAGPGTYTTAETGEKRDGSPIRMLTLIAENKDFRSRVSTIFIEHDKALFNQLERRVDEFCANHPGVRKPVCLLGTFSDQVIHVIDRLKRNLAPTFLFVDPCGISGASLDTIRAVMDCEKCEAFIFFNIDGVRRTAGLEMTSNALVELLGTRERAHALHDEFRKATDARGREEMILSHYCAAIKEVIGAKYIVPFRVEHEDRQTTSHYLIHATKHPLGFRIMKDVMWRRGHAEDMPGGLMLAQKSRSKFFPLFDERADEIKQSILDALRTGPKQVSVFYEQWPERPDDRYCEPAYRNALLELEADGRVEVLSKDGMGVAGVATRPRRSGKPTLAKDYFVRIRKS